MQRALDLEVKKIKVFEEQGKHRAEEHDDHMLFLKSLHPYLKKAEDHLSLRVEIMRVIKDSMNHSSNSSFESCNSIITRFLRLFNFTDTVFAIFVVLEESSIYIKSLHIITFFLCNFYKKYKNFKDVHRMSGKARISIFINKIEDAN